MSDHSVFPRAAALFGLAVLAATAACNSTLTLPPAGLLTVTDTVTLWALSGTSLSEPSAYDVIKQTVAHTDRTSAFDFAFDIRTDSLHDTSAVLLPRGALGLYVDGGLQVTPQAFDAVTKAPTSGYQDTAAVALKVGTVVLAASRSQACNFGYVYPTYAKLNVLTLDLVARSVTFAILIDPNCGYRSLKTDSFPPTE